ncbi:DUF58 domain-containing protein [Cryptosporangium arvum]|uniref:DUF58 domain-containing protein n=1 Tax=Cryptosporangium arvum TaxID=80871 RepID=UPI0004B99342|nr:DUF58 domain-containing protein [Cryptosporangium arvum]
MAPQPDRTAPERLLRRLEWKVGRRLDGRLQGAYRTVWRGTGIDFSDLRSYTPEDDVRHIDWNVTARLDEPFVRQYTEDRELTAWLVVDTSASMRVGRSDAGKASLATELALSLAQLMVKGGNRVGAILYDNGSHQIIPPRSGRNQVLRLARELSRVDSAGSGTTTDLDAMLRLAASTTSRRRALVFVLSDFIAEPGWDRSLTRLVHRHEVVAVRIADPVESALPDVGLILVQDAETGEQLLVDTSDPLLQRRLGEQARARDDAVDSGLARAGVTAHRIGTDEEFVPALVGLVRRSRR